MNGTNSPKKIFQSPWLWVNVLNDRVGTSARWAQFYCLGNWWHIPNAAKRVRFTLSNKKLPGGHEFTRGNGSQFWGSDYGPSGIHMDPPLERFVYKIARRYGERFWLSLELELQEE